MALAAPNILDPYLDNQRLRHLYYHETVKLRTDINVHFNGEYSDTLIDCRRPGESEEIKKYRKEIFEPITKPVMSKVFNAFQKIRRSPDFMLQFPVEDKTIRDGEDLENYLTVTYPKTGSFVNWFFNIAFRHYLTDANSMILVMPENPFPKENEYYRPYTYIFNSEQIIDYRYGLWYILKSKETVTYSHNGTDYYDGFVYYAATDTHIQRFEQTSTDNKYSEAWAWEHNIGKPPVVTMQGIVTDMSENYSLYESRLSPMVPHLNEALREYSDLQAEIVQHVHSTLWAHQPEPCVDCKGFGKIAKENSAPIKCKTCKGKGYFPFNPYETLVIRPAKAMETPTPSPPAGYIQKDLGIAELQDKRIRQHKIDALAAIQMEHLAEVPLQESGIAKQFDGEGANNTVHAIAEDDVRIHDESIFFINEIRYAKTIPNPIKRKEQLPVINVPEKFDLLSETYIINGLTAMKNAGVDPAIINASQIELAGKSFSTDTSVKDRLSLKLTLDPFGGVGEDEINSRLEMSLITKEDAVIHANINKFIDMALEQNKDFITIERSLQRAKLTEYAKAEMKLIEPEIKEEPVIVKPELVG